MTTFANIAAIIAFVKSGTDLTAVAQATLGQDKSAGKALLLEETSKAAVSAALYNNPSRLLTALAAVKAGKKTTQAKFWLESTTSLMRSLPLNASGDAKRIPDESGFVSEVNDAIVKFNESWTKFEEDRVQRAEARKEAKGVMAEPSPTPTPEPVPTPVPTPAVQPLDDAERQEFLTQISKLEAYSLKLKEANASLERENDALKTANEKLTAELDALRPPAPKRAKKTPA